VTKPHSSNWRRRTRSWRNDLKKYADKENSEKKVIKMHLKRLEQRPHTYQAK
jgi:hypothetical protein